MQPQQVVTAGPAARRSCGLRLGVIHPPRVSRRARGEKSGLQVGFCAALVFLAERVPSSPDGTLSETAMVRLLSQRVKMAVMVFHSELWRYPMCGCREWSLDHILGGCATD